MSPPPTDVQGFERFIAWTHDEREAGQHVCFGGRAGGARRRRSACSRSASSSPDFATAEWGFAIGSAFWGTGLFVESATLVVDFAFDTLGVHRLEARAAVLNGRGNGALRKIGAVQEGVLRRSLLRNGQYLDQILWSILARGLAHEETEPQAHACTYPARPSTWAGPFRVAAEGTGTAGLFFRLLRRRLVRQEPRPVPCYPAPSSPVRCTLYPVPCHLFPDVDVADFDYALPAELIAQVAAVRAGRRDGSSSSTGTPAPRRITRCGDLPRLPARRRSAGRERHEGVSGAAAGPARADRRRCRVPAARRLDRRRALGGADASRARS